MFSADTYRQRRAALANAVASGIIILPGNNESPMNYAANGYHFRQDSTFLYYFGVDAAGMAGIIDCESGESVLYGNDFTVDDIVWMGPQPKVAEFAAKIGAQNHQPLSAFADAVRAAGQKKRAVHYLTPYRFEQKLQLMQILGRSEQEMTAQASAHLARAVVNQRSVKSDEELQQITLAHDITREMHLTAMKMAAPGLLESAIAGEIEGIALKRGGRLSFPAIVSVRGETLHNHYHGNTMQDGDLLVNDSGAENSMGYAADITRTIPVSGKFSTRQREIYEIVLKANNEAIAASRPGVPYRQVHLLSARIVASGLAELGLMKGDPDAAVTAGAHALFFPHGLGHMMGLDVHDMENIGEQYVGYGEGEQRSKQFGLAYLRLARNLEPGFVLTVEPGIYFIPALIDQWQKAGQHAEFINYEKVRDYIGFGGIRIEDDIVITSDGCSVIGEPIAKDVADVEAACAAR
jgi:Xaa-Pro aminopeptidase